MPQLTLEDIKESIIHRYENLLLDSVTIDDPESFSGNLALAISNNDPLNRTLFFKESPAGTQVLSIPFYMEILALASIVSSGKIKPGEAAIFAGIANFEAKAYLPLNETLTGSVNRVSAKGSFLKYAGELSVNNNCVATGNMTAFFSTINFDEANATEADIDELPDNCKHPTNKTNRHKPSTMIVSDALTYLNHEENSCISRYTYPDSHPLIKGHFPGNPIMMGVMQWMSLEDALCAYLEQTQQSGQHSWTCDATIYNQHRATITVIKGARLNSWINVPNTKNQCDIAATQRITFKNMVKPNDTLYTHISNITQA